MIITEAELRAHWHKDRCALITVPPGSLLTPSARDFLRAHGIRVAVEGEGMLDLNRRIMATASPAAKGTSPAGRGGKPEHMTHLRGSRLVPKTHPVIAWRGQMDLFDCQLVETQATLAAVGEEELAKRLEEVVLFAQRLMAAEVREEPFPFGALCDWAADEIREMSHHPDRYFGIGHTAMSYLDGMPVALLNGLRAKAREVELYANRAFAGENGECLRPDLILALNRLSSLFYVLVCQRRAGLQREKRLPVGISGRHLHLSRPHLDSLFGRGYELSKLKDLSQPGQFAAQETVRLVGPKGKIDKVRILGPVRGDTQVEISATDSFQLGVKPAVRDSGQLDGSAALRLEGPAGAVELDRGVIVAARHIHLHPDQAAAWQLRDGQRVKVRLDSERPATFADVLVRVSPQYRGELHLDTDEANAALATGDTQAIIVGV